MYTNTPRGAARGLVHIARRDELNVHFHVFCDQSAWIRQHNFKIVHEAPTCFACISFAKPGWEMIPLVYVRRCLE